MKERITHQGCSVAGCARSAENHHVMCGFHWHMLPRSLHARVQGLLQYGHTSSADRDRVLQAASCIAGALSATPRRVVHAAKELTRIDGMVSLTALSTDLSISKKRAASIIEIMINDGSIDDGDYLGIYHLQTHNETTQ